MSSLNHRKFMARKLAELIFKKQCDQQEALQNAEKAEHGYVAIVEADLGGEYNSTFYIANDGRFTDYVDRAKVFPTHAQAFAAGLAVPYGERVSTNLLRWEFQREAHQKGESIKSLTRTRRSCLGKVYDVEKKISYRQRLALILGQKQRQRPATIWA